METETTAAQSSRKQLFKLWGSGKDYHSEESKELGKQLGLRSVTVRNYWNEFSYWTEFIKGDKQAHERADVQLEEAPCKVTEEQQRQAQDYFLGLVTTEPLTVKPDTISPNGVKYREYQPQPLPESYKELLPTWLYQSLFWTERVRPLKVKPDDSLLRKLQIGAAVFALAIFAIVIFLIAIVVMG